MAEKGYSKNRFPNYDGEVFDCPICKGVVKDPKQCKNCGGMFCSKCIDELIRKNNKCPSGCPGNSIQPIAAPALINIYRELDIKCSNCSKVVKMGDLVKHEAACGLIKCTFNSECKGLEDKNLKASKPVCSENCLMMQKLIDTEGDVKKMYLLLKTYAPKSVSVPAVMPAVENGPRRDLRWNTKQCGMNIVFTGENTCAYISEAPYVFRSLITTEGFSSGRHYWEIHADQRTENELKIGVATSDAFNYNTAFCDHKLGFAYYGTGHLRSGSNSSGGPYGKKFKKTGVLGVFLNMNEGTLSFSLNGEDMGVAFKDPSLTKGPIYPAVGLLHAAGCIIKGELPIPPIYASK